MHCVKKKQICKKKVFNLLLFCQTLKNWNLFALAPIFAFHLIYSLFSYVEFYEEAIFLPMTNRAQN